MSLVPTIMGKAALAPSQWVEEWKDAEKGWGDRPCGPCLPRALLSVITNEPRDPTSRNYPTDTVMDFLRIQLRECLRMRKTGTL